MREVRGEEGKIPPPKKKDGYALIFMTSHANFLSDFLHVHPIA